MSVFLISDLHLGDKHYLNKIHEHYGIQMTPKEHCNLLINNCNSVLKKDDKLYILGDITIGKITKELFSFFYHVKGKKYLVAGNHDTNMVIQTLMKFNFIQEIHGSLEYDGFIFTHIPIVLTEAMYYKGNVHGHIHDDVKQSVLDDTMYFNVCANLNRFMPVDFETIKYKLAKENDKN